ncbi:hypothetical protein BDF19DRAFT_212220 [Syncephalis fuscata]|nr:hypothetical protein BDF19DRAFT_212220 [Syncephalis fuscata]
MLATATTATSATLHVCNQSKAYRFDQRIFYSNDGSRNEQAMPIVYGEEYLETLKGVEGTLLYNVHAETGESGLLKLYILVGWDWASSTFYLGLVECEKGDTAVWRTPREFHTWFNRASSKLLVNDQHNIVCWSVFNADRFALSAAFNGETSTIDVIIQNTTQQITSRPLEPIAAMQRSKTASEVVYSEASSKMKKIVPAIRKTMRGIAVNIEITHPDIALCHPVAYPNFVPEALVSKDIVRMGRPYYANFQGSPLSTMRGFLMYRLVKRILTDDQGYDFGQAALLGSTHIYLVIGWKIPALKAKKTCAFMVQFEDNTVPTSDEAKEQFLNGFINAMLGSEHETNAYALDHGVRFQMLAKASSQLKFTISVELAPLGKSLGTANITDDNFESFAGFVSYYPKDGFMCSMKDARKKIVDELKNIKKTSPLCLLHLVENRSSHLQLKFVNSDENKHVSGSKIILGQGEFDYNHTLVADEKHLIHRVFEVISDFSQNTNNMDSDNEQQTFLVIGNEAFTSTMAIVFCWSAQEKNISGTQIRHFVEEVEAMHLFIAGSLQVQSFIDYNFEKFSIIGYKTLSTPQVMTVALDDKVYSGKQICESKLPRCLELTIENRHPSVTFVEPHIMSIGCKFIKDMSVTHITPNGRVSCLFSALPLEGCLGRGMRISYALEYHNDHKSLTTGEKHEKQVQITWKADLDGTNRHNESYESYIHFSSPENTYKREETSETIYSRRGFNDTAPDSAVIETYVHGSTRCYVALILLPGNRSAASRLYILATASLNDIKKYTADLNQTPGHASDGDDDDDDDDDNAGKQI